MWNLTTIWIGILALVSGLGVYSTYNFWSYPYANDKYVKMREYSNGRPEPYFWGSAYHRVPTGGGIGYGK